MIETFGRPVRAHVENLIRTARRSLLIVSPFISSQQAGWLLNLVATKPHPAAVRTLTSINERSVGAGALELEALVQLATAPAGGEVVNLPRLHAKVYVADSDAAIVTSANLTRGGLEGNYEYGVVIHEPEVVARIRKDIEDYARLGNQLTQVELFHLCELGRELRTATDRMVCA